MFARTLTDEERVMSQPKFLIFLNYLKIGTEVNYLITGSGWKTKKSQK